MTRRERFLTAVRGGVPDRVPLFDFLFQRPMYEALIGRTPAAYNARDAVALALALENDAVWLPYGGFSGFQPEYLDADTYIDEWGTTFRTNASSWPIDAPVAYPIASRSDLDAYRAPDPTLPGRAAEIEAAAGLEADGLAITGGVAGPFTACWMLMGYERMCYSIYDEPDLLTDVFRLCNEYNIEAARQCAAAGCDAIWVSEDLGDSTHGFLRLDTFRSLYLPHLVELTDAVDALGLPMLLHSCGRITDYLPDLAQTRIAAVHPMQRTAGMDLAWMKANYGSRFCLIGNIDSSRTLPYGTPAEVEAEVREALRVAAPGGGYVLASDHSLHDGIPPENILALRDTGLAYG